MSKRAIHYYPWDGGTESDMDMPDFVLCGTDGDLSQDQLSTTEEGVNCKRCLRCLAADRRRTLIDHNKSMQAREAWAEECAF